MSAVVVTFGEVMARLAVPIGERLEDATAFQASYGGGEANVAVALAQTGMPARFLTRVPENELGRAALRRLRGLGVDVDAVLHGGSRLGAYFLEPGAAQRPSKVLYDRAGSAFAELDPGELDWPALLAGGRWFHTTGITPAVSASAARAAIDGASAARAMGLRVSVDLNYRAKLWGWGAEPGSVMRELVAQADVIVGNEEDASKVFGLAGPEVADADAQLDPEAYRPITAELFELFPSTSTIAFSLRTSRSASHNGWSGVLATRAGELLVAPRYEILPIVDRVGAGDAFAAGLIRCLAEDFDDVERALRFAVCASAIKHTIAGDLNTATFDEIERLVAGDASGRVLR